MKPRIRRIVRWSSIVAGSVVLLAVTCVIMLHFGWFVKCCILPFVHGATPYRIEFSEWRCRVWNYVSVDNLVVSEVGQDGRASNVVAEARTLTVRYRLMSLFGSHPVIEQVSAVSPAVGLAGKVPEPGGATQGGSTSTKTDAPRLPSGIPSLPLPLSLGSLRIRNGNVAYTDASGMRVTVRGLDIDAGHIAPNDVASVTASAVVSLNDDQGIAITRLPVAVSGRFAFGESVVPMDADASIRVSNVIGRINGVMLSPLTIDVVLDARQAAQDVVELARAEVRVGWLGAMLGRVAATGRVDVLHQCARGGLVLDVNPSPFWQALLPTNAAIDIAHAGVDASLAVDIRGSDHIYGIAGMVAAKNISFADTVVGRPPDTDIAAVFTAKFNDVEQAIDMASLALSASQRGAPVLTVRAESPVRVCWRDKQALARSLNDHAIISLVLRNFQAAQINSLLNDQGLQIADGVVSANVTLDVAGQGRHVAARGALEVKDIDAAMGKARWRDIDAVAQVDAALDNFHMLSCAKNSVELALDNEPAGQVAAGGFFDLSGGSNRVALVISKLRSELLQRIIDPQRRNRRLEGLDLTLQAVATKSDRPAAPQDIELAMTVDNRFRARQGEWQRLALDTRASLTPTMARLDTFGLSFAPGEWTDNTLNAVGTVYWVPTNLVSRLVLSSRHFDATVLLDTLCPLSNGPPTATGTRASNDTTAPGSSGDATPAAEPPPPPLRGRDVSLDIRIAELRAREMRVTPFDLDLRISNKVLTAVSRDIRPNGGVLDLAARADLGVTGFVYDATLATTNVPLKPFINSWIASRRDKIDGLLASTFSCTGRGITLPNLKENFSADLDAWLLDGYLYNAIILDDVGKALRMKALREFKFGDGRVDMVAKDGVVTVHTFAMQGVLAKVNARGTVDFDQKINIDLFLALNGQLVADVLGSKVPMGLSRGTYIELPAPIPIRGTLKERNVGVSYAQILPSLFKAIGSEPVNLIKGMINSIPQNKTTKGIEEGIGEGLKLIEGFVQPKKKSTE